jgi:DNA-binding protein H-NS
MMCFPKPDARGGARPVPRFEPFVRDPTLPEMTRFMDLEPPEPEKVAAIRKIRRLMDFWQIDPHELQGVGVTAPRPRPVAPPTSRYRHPISGDTWDGQGGQPDWLRTALIKEGYTVDELRIAAPSDDPAAQAAELEAHLQPDD